MNYAMKTLITLLAISMLMSIPVFQSHAQEEETQPLNVAIVMESFTCDSEITNELIAFAEITYIQLYQYYLPNVPQVYCFTKYDEYTEMAYNFILQYNDYVILMFEDELWYEYAPVVLSEDVGIDDEDLTKSEGTAYMEYGLIVVHYYNNESDPNEYIDTHDWNSLTLTHELAHSILYDYGYGEDVYIDWVHERDVFYNEYTTGYEIFSPLTNNWYEVFERYPVEEDF